MAPWALAMFFLIVLVSRACGGCVRVASRADCPTDAMSSHLLISSKPCFLLVAGMGAVRACPTLACMPPDFARVQKLSDRSARALVRPRGWPRAVWRTDRNLSHANVHGVVATGKCHVMSLFTVG